MAGKKTIGELSVILGMDTEVYQKKIRESKSSFQDLAKSALASAATFAAGFATIGGSVEFVKNTIAATQFTADKFEVAIAGAKQGVDNFFIALSSGDWSSFTSNMSESIQTAKDLANEMDALGDVRRGLSIQEVQMQGKQFELMEKMRDKTGKYTIAQQKQFYAEYVKLTEAFNAKRLDAAYRERDAILDNYSAITGLENIQIYQILKDYGDQYENRFNAVKEQLDKAQANFSRTHDVSKEGFFYDKANFNAYLNSLSDVDRFYTLLYRNFGKLNDAKLDTATASIVAVGRALNANVESAVSLQKLENQIFGKSDGAIVKRAPIEPLKNISIPSIAKGAEPGVIEWEKVWERIPNAVSENMVKAQQRFNQLSEDINSSVQNFATDLIIQITSGIGEAMASGDWDNFGASILEGVGRFAQQIGSMFIAYGVAAKAFQFAIENPITAIIAGGALVAIGAGISKVASNAKNAGSGSSSVPSYGGGGSSFYSGGGSTNRTVQLVWKRAGKDLIAIIKDENTSYNALTGKR